MTVRCHCPTLSASAYARPPANPRAAPRRPLLIPAAHDVNPIENHPVDYQHGQKHGPNDEGRNEKENI
jgi:hypothetical protein